MPDTDIVESMKWKTTSPVSASWQANLRLGFTEDAGVTRLTDRWHFGPLRVQKPLYPEGGQICHAIIVHPPGGVVGGDRLEIALALSENAHALITTPGAAKWYKANGNVSGQTVQIDVAQGSSVEWLPQETIFFDAAHVQLSQTINLASDASFIGCDILCFGRTASGEAFNSGKISQHSTIRREGKLIWFEQGAILGGSTSMTGLLGLCGNTVCATLMAVGKMVPASVIAALREEASSLLDGSGRFGVTQLKSVIVVRYLGDASEMARAVMLLAWRHLRPEIIGREAIELRVWNT